jgi:hypothetical protein
VHISAVERAGLLQNYRIHASQGFRVPTLETSLEQDVSAIDEALSRLPSE